MNKKELVAILIVVVVIEIVLMIATLPPTYVDKWGMEITNENFYGEKEINPLLNYHYIKFGIIILATFVISGFVFNSLRRNDLGDSD